MKKIILLLLIITLASSTACRKTLDTAADNGEIRTYLIAGMDDAADNTDVLVLVSYNTAANTATVAHIPRDTLTRYGGEYVKINSIFPRARLSGKTNDEAMKTLADYLSSAMGVRIDGYFSADIGTFTKMVDILGGVDIELDSELVICDEHDKPLFTLNKGVNRLDGYSAAHFVRYRKGYATGDLGRIDAQKIFLTALFKTVKDQVGIEETARLLLALGPDVRTNAGLLDVFGFLVKNRNQLDDVDLRFVTVPGEATMINGKSFYVFNRKNTAEILIRDFYIASQGFDPERFFVNEDNLAVKNIYYDETAEYKFSDF